MTIRTAAVVLAALAFSVTAGCSSAPKAEECAACATPTMQSQVLIKPMGGVLAEAVLAQSSAGKKLPEDFKTPEYVESVIQSIQAQYPAAFAVTDEQEKAFEAGTFDDKANADSLGKTLEKVDQQKVHLTTVNAYLAEQFKAGKLKGVELELAARLIESQLDAQLAADLHK
jgi:hypothetical protein